MSFDIRTVRDLTHCILNMGDVEDEFGASVSPELSIYDAKGNVFIVNDFYLRGDGKAVMILSEGGEE